MDLRPRRKRSPSPGNSSQRSGSVSSVGSSKSDASSGSGPKRGRSASRKTEEDVIEIVHDRLVEMMQTTHLNCIRTNRKIEQKRKEKRNADPLYHASQKYAKGLLANTSTQKKKDELKEGIRLRVKEKLEQAENNRTDRRAAVLARLERNAEERKEHWEMMNIHSPTLYKGPLEEMDERIWQNIVINYPLIALAYQNKYKEFMERVDECEEMQKSSEPCECEHNYGYRRLNPLAVAAGRGYLDFCNYLTIAAFPHDEYGELVRPEKMKEHKHLRELIEKWNKEFGVVGPAVENEQFPIVQCLLNAKVLGKMKEIHGDFRVTYTLTVPCMLASVKESVLLKDMLDLRNRYVSQEDFPQLVLEAVNTDDVSYVEWLLHLIMRSAKLPLHELLTKTAETEKSTRRKDSAFHRAILRGNHEMVEMLFKYVQQEQEFQIDSNGLKPMYAALVTGAFETYDYFYSRLGSDFNHTQLIFDIGIETNQEHLSRQAFHSMVDKYFNKFPNKLYDSLMRAISCRTYTLVDQMVQWICQSIYQRDRGHEKNMKWVLSAALTCAHQLFTEPDEKVRTNLCAMLILAGARPEAPRDPSTPDPSPDCFKWNKDLQDVFSRLDQREVIEGRPMEMVFCGRNTAMAELLARLG